MFSKRILVLCSALLLLELFTTSAQSEDTELGEIVVTARRTPENYAEIPENISVITAEEIARMPAHDLAEVLNLVAGVDLQPRGPFGHPSSVSLQGCDPRHVRVMVDGVLLNSQGMAFADPSQIPIENVARIEIIKGTGASVWGSSLGGVVNVITRPPQDQPTPRIDFTTSGGWGDGGFWKRALELSGQTGKFGYLLWESNLDTNDRFRDNSEIINQKGSAKFTYLFTDQTRLETNFHYNGSDMGGFEFKTLNPPYGEDLFYTMRYGSVKFSRRPQDERFGFDATLKYSDQASTVKRFLLATDTPLNKVASRDVFTGLDLQSTVRLAQDQTMLVGTDLGRDQLDSDLMRDNRNLRRYGYYTSYQRLLGERYSLSLGARHDDNDAYGQQFSPSAGLVYHLPQRHTDLRISVAKAFNAPPLIYKYLNGNPNPDLKAERGRAIYESGFETRPLPDLWFKFAAYRAEVTDYVVYDSATGLMNNVGRIRRQGMESELSYDVVKDLQAQAGWSLNRVEDRKTGRIVEGGGIARLTYNLGLNYTVWKGLNLNLQGNYRFWNEPPSSKANDRKFIWDARLSYEFTSLLSSPTNSPRQASIFLSTMNILDSAYWYKQALPLPGRRVELGLQYNF